MKGCVRGGGIDRMCQECVSGGSSIYRMCQESISGGIVSTGCINMSLSHSLSLSLSHRVLLHGPERRGPSGHKQVVRYG